MRHRSHRCLGLTRRRVGEEFEKIGVGAADGDGPTRPSTPWRWPADRRRFRRAISINRVSHKDASAKQT
jgi:hypothetical protein